MELIVKPTKRCNFSCTFCSTPPIEPNDEISTDDIIRFLKRYPDTRTIIINGGDPLMMPPEFYLTLIKYIRENDLKTTISLSSNLWDFYLDPDKWMPVFKESDILLVGTSFQYGEGRQITRSQPYTEELFVKVFTKFKDTVGYAPFFICVITEENEDSVVKTAELARSLGTTCRINPVMKSGRQGKLYPMHKMMKHYLNLIDLGYDDVEFNCKQIKDFSSSCTSCPMPNNRSCDEHIRCLSPGHHYHSCPAINDDYIDDEGKYDISFEAEMYGAQFTPLKQSVELMSLKSQCFVCPMFKLCNACHKYIKDAKSEGETYIQEHCTEMLKMQPILEKYL